MNYKASLNFIGGKHLSLNISSQMLNLPGQRVKQVQHDLDRQRLNITCSRDRRFRVVDPTNNKPASINCYRRRTIRDLPLCGLDCYLEIELAQVATSTSRLLLKAADFVDKGSRYNALLPIGQRLMPPHEYQHRILAFTPTVGNGIEMPQISGG